MRTSQLLKRNLAYYWRTNIAVILGVAAAVAVLSGALLVGDSVRGSLRDLFLLRLGNTQDVISAPGFFREQLAREFQRDFTPSREGSFSGLPLIAIEGSVSHEIHRSRAGGVRVYGVGEQFWKFHGREVRAPQDREMLIGESLARELGAKAGDSLLVQIEKPSDVPIESLYGQKDELGRTLRLTIRETLSPEQLGEFTTNPQQSTVRTVFVDLKLLQREIEQPDKVNTILLSGATDRPSLSEAQRADNLKHLLASRVQLEDYNIRWRALDQQRGITIERGSTLLDDNLAKTATDVANSLNFQTIPILSYVANGITSRERTIPYSLITAIDDSTFESLKTNTIQDASGKTPIILNEWAARDLNANVGDAVSLEYYIWHEDGKLETKQAEFQLVAIVPISGLAADRDLVPDYPGISESPSMADWDPPFPVDLKRIRPQDEEYWDQYRTTPKAFVPLSAGQKLWQSRYGKLTSIRVMPGDMPLDQAANLFQRGLLDSLSPAAMGITVLPVRAEGLAASRGATDFGEYFLYFSFFLVVSALLLTALFFKLGIEQRLREIGTLQAIGFAASRIRNLFLAEGLLLALIGSALGLLGAIGYAALLMYGLRTWWIDAVGTTSLTLHVTWQSLAAGAAGGVAAAVICIFLTLRKIGRSSTRSLITGTTNDAETIRVTKSYVFLIAVAMTITGVALLLAGALKLIPQVAGFFGGGVVLLVAGICFLSVWLRRSHAATIRQPGWRGMSQLGFRNTTYRPTRTVLCVTLIASAAFIIVAVDAFRRSGTVANDKKSGNGGFPFVAESLLPIVHDLNSVEGRESLNLNNTNEEA